MFNHVALLAFVSLCISSVSAQATVNHFLNVTNNCPITVPFYVGGELKQNLTTIAVDPSKSFVYFKDTSAMGGFFWTTANKGNGDGATRLASTMKSHYYIVKDPSWINVGVSVAPIGRAPEANGFCSVAKCELPNNCGDDVAFPFDNSPGTAAPPPSNTPPKLPQHRCPGIGDAGFSITFCPSGEIPNLSLGPDTISLASNPNKCLDVRGGVFANGTPVQIYDCNGTRGQKWELRRGYSMIRLAGTDFCLDATDPNPANGTGLKIWQCYDDLIAQRWYFNGVTKRIWLHNDNDWEGGGGCIDLADGNVTNGRQLQMWKCGPIDNQNQHWDVREAL